MNYTIKYTAFQGFSLICHNPITYYVALPYYSTYLNLPCIFHTDDQIAQEYHSTHIFFSYSITHMPLENFLMFQNSPFTPCPPRAATPHFAPTHVASQSCFLLYDQLALKTALLRSFLELEFAFAYSSTLSSSGQQKLFVICTSAFLDRHFSKILCSCNTNYNWIQLK